MRRVWVVTNGLAKNRRLFVGSIVSLVAMFVVFLLLLTPRSGSTIDGPSSTGAEDGSDISLRNLMANYLSVSLPEVVSTDDR